MSQLYDPARREKSCRYWIKLGAIMIDVGIERQADGSLRGNANFDGMVKVTGWLTLVPGSIGPMTRASVLENLMEAAETTAP